MTTFTAAILPDQGMLRAAERGYPVDLPGLSAVGGERLFPPGMRGVHLGPHVAHPDRRALPCVVALEGADPVVEPADHGYVQLAAAGLGRPPDAPHLLLRA